VSEQFFWGEARLGYAAYVLPKERKMALTVTVDSTSQDGADFTITITKTGSDTGSIAIKTTEGGASHTDSYDVYAVKASAMMLTCTTTVFWFHPTLSCQVDDARPQGAATVTVTVANAPAHNGPTNYQTSSADAANIKQFLSAAAFPPLGAGA
jgi:hypothetical protein